MNQAFLDQTASFISATRDLIFVRPEDGVLILRPNRVQYLNATATELLDALYRPADVDVAAVVTQFAARYAVPEERIIADVEALLRTLETLLQNRPGDAPAIARTTFGSHQRKFPIISEIALTYRCQNRCFFCYASAPDRGRQTPEMRTAEVKTVIDKIMDQARVPMISFTGGEPTLRPDLPEFIAHAVSRDMRTNLITNGIRCGDPAYVAELAAAGLHSAQVSLEAGAAATHDAKNAAFPHRLVQLSGNRRLTAMYDDLRVHLRIARAHLNATSWLARVPIEADEHLAILEALEARDVTAMQRALDAHLRRSAASLIEDVSRPEGSATGPSPA